MKITFNAKNRSTRDWHNLFAKADERFRIVSIRTPPSSALSIIEVVWDGC